MKKLFLLIFFATLFYDGSAQRMRKKMPAFAKPNSQEIFLEKQWWLGFSAGPNASQVIIDQTYSVISPTNYAEADIAKNYKPFHSIGSHATFALTFTFRGISISVEPSYRTNRFVYSNEYEWHDSEVSDNRLELTYKQDQKVSYLQLPLLIRYEYSFGKLTPYAQLGYYSSFLIDATKSLVISGTDYASGGTNEFENEPIIVGAKDLFAKNHWGLTGGAGLYYKLGNVRLQFEALYNLGMSNIASTRNRYGSDRLTGVGDSFDDMKLNTISLSVGCLFPLRFLGSGYKAMTN
jgi:hypothetical protein